MISDNHSTPCSSGASGLERHPASLSDTFEIHRPLLFATAYRMLGSAAEAEDIVQDAYLRCQTAAAHDIRAPRAYLCTIVRRLCLDALTSSRATRERSLDQVLPDPLLLVSDDFPLQTAIQHESISRACHILLERLTPPERAVLVLHAVFEYPYPDIAALLGLSAGNCRQLSHRAQLHLADEYARFMPSPEAHQYMVAQFLAAVQQGNLPGLLALLANDVTRWFEDGNAAGAARRSDSGTQQATRLVLGGARTLSAAARRDQCNEQCAKLASSVVPSS